MYAPRYTDLYKWNLGFMISGARDQTFQMVTIPYRVL